MSKTHLLQVAASRPAPPGGRRIGGAEVERRVKVVEEHLARGAPRSEIIAATGLPPRTVDGYLRRVRESWRDDALEGRQDLRCRSLDRLMALRERLLRAQAWSPLVALERLIADVEGVRNATEEGPRARALGAPRASPSITTEGLRERLPLLVQASARLALRTEDSRAIESTRAALTRSLLLLDTEPSGSRNSADRSPAT
jgi:hypothetical protein